MSEYPLRGWNWEERHPPSFPPEVLWIKVQNSSSWETSVSIPCSLQFFTDGKYNGKSEEVSFKRAEILLEPTHSESFAFFHRLHCHLVLCCLYTHFTFELPSLHVFLIGANFFSPKSCPSASRLKNYLIVTSRKVNLAFDCQTPPNNSTSMPFSFVANPQPSKEISGCGLQPLICIKVTERSKQLTVKETEMVKNRAVEIALSQSDFVQRTSLKCFVQTIDPL